MQASSIRVDTLLLARPSASYRDAASVDGASVRVRVTRPPDASLAVLHRAGETVLTLGIGAAVIALAVALLPPGGACGVAAVMVTLIAGALQGALPGCAGAMRAIYGSVAKRTRLLEIPPREPLETVLEWSHAAELVVTRSPSRAHAQTLNVVIPAPSVHTARAVVAAGRARVVVAADEGEITLVGDLAAEDAQLVVAGLRGIARS